MSDTAMAISHGAIAGGTILVPDLTQGIAAYRDTLGLELIETGIILDDLALQWGTPGIANQAYAILRPTSGSECFVRLIESNIPEGFKPTTTYGWAAFEMTAQGVFDWAEKLADSNFEVIGPPREIAGLAYFVPMQALGPGREMIYLNEVRQPATPSNDLPEAKSPVDQIFITVLAAPNRQQACDWYCNNLNLDLGETHTIEYTMINKAFDQPAGTQSTLTMVQNGRMPIVEIDDYPDAADTRQFPKGMLPPGNAMVTLFVKNLAELDLDWIRTPVIVDGAMYEGRKTGTVRGPAGEWLELIEIAG
ncbi:MAG: hypothetical protein ABJP48_13165 [Erythrobacter sp.]